MGSDSLLQILYFLALCFKRNKKELELTKSRMNRIVETKTMPQKENSEELTTQRPWGDLGGLRRTPSARKGRIWMCKNPLGIILGPLCFLLLFHLPNQEACRSGDLETRRVISIRLIIYWPRENMEGK